MRDASGFCSAAAMNGSHPKSGVHHANRADRKRRPSLAAVDLLKWYKADCRSEPRRRRPSSGGAESIRTLLSSEFVAKPQTQSTRTVDRICLDNFAVVRDQVRPCIGKVIPVKLRLPSVFRDTERGKISRIPRVVEANGGALQCRAHFVHRRI